MSLAEVSVTCCLNDTRCCLLTKLLCLLGPDGFCDAADVSSGVELPLAHASERQVRLFFIPVVVFTTYD